MISISLKEAAEAMDGHLKGDSGVMINGVFTDSRKVKSGRMFFALKGKNIDGHNFTRSILANNCTAVVSNPDYHFSNTILVEDTKKSIYDLACYYRQKKVPNVKIAAITGSVGKTTTKNMMGAIVASEYNTYMTKGNLNSLIGVPLSVFDIEEQHKYAVLEIGMNQPGEINLLSRLVRPDLAVITNIGSAHMEAFGSIDKIKEEKFSITSGLAQNGMLIINGDNGLLKNYDKKCIYFGIDNICDFRAVNIKENQTETRFDIIFNNKIQKIVLKQKGMHNIYNALSAFAVGTLWGITANTAAKTLENFENDGYRQNIYKKNDICIIADCYNASPESMKAALGVLKSFNGRRIAVLGDMFELGYETDKFHIETAEYAVNCTDELIFIGDKAYISIQAAKKGKAFEKNEKKQATEYLKALITAGDTVLFKASNGMRFEEIIKDLEL